MKQAVKMLVTYILILVLGTIIGTLVVAQYHTVCTLVAGHTQAPFQQALLVQSFFAIVPVVLVCSSVLLALYAVRHNTRRVIAAVTYDVLSAITWGVVFPLFMAVCPDDGAVVPAPPAVVPSAGYFRQLDRTLYYTSGIAEHNSVQIALDDLHPETMLTESDDVAEILVRQSAPFHDVLISRTMEYRALAFLHEGYGYLMAYARRAWSGGIVGWLCFAAFGLALCSVYAFIAMSSWRLINSISVCFFSVCICLSNFYYFSRWHAAAGEMTASGSGLFRAVDEPLLVGGNLLVAIIFITVGAVTAIIRAHKRRLSV